MPKKQICDELTKLERCKPSDTYFLCFAGAPREKAQKMLNLKISTQRMKNISMNKVVT